MESYSGRDDYENRALALNDHGLRLYYAGDYTGAIIAYEEALDLQVQLDNRQDQAIILLNIGVALGETGRPVEAASAVERSLAISLERGDLQDAEESRARTSSPA